MNPVSRILASLFAILVIVGAFIFGIFVLAGVAVLGLLGWVVFSIRRWWLRRSGAVPASEEPTQARSEPAQQSEIIEAEYTVISRRRE